MAGEGALAAADGEARQAPAARRSREARQAPAARRSRMPAKGSCGRCFFGGGLWADRLRSRPRPRAPDRRHGPPGRCRGFLGLGFCLAFLFHALQVIEPAAGRACSSCQASPLRPPVFLHGFGVSSSRSASARASGCGRFLGFGCRNCPNTSELLTLMWGHSWRGPPVSDRRCLVSARNTRRPCRWSLGALRGPACLASTRFRAN